MTGIPIIRDEPIKRNAAHAAAVKLLDELMARSGRECVHCYADDGFEVREYGDALSGRAFTVNNISGRIEETDR